MGDIIKAVNLPANLAAAFGYQEDDLSKGAGAGFPVVSYRGKVWRVGHRGEVHKLTTPDGDPLPSIRVVILRANPALSKIYYEKRYTEGDDAAPDCFSVDGVKPDASVENPQNPQCEGCPKAAWGSRVSDDGRQLKACQDSRRLAVVPANDITNEALGGPMLLRVPAASLANLAAYDSLLKKANVAYFGVATKIYFDDEAAFPQLCFEYDGANTERLSADDAKKIIELREGDQVERILNSVAAAETHGAATTAVDEEPAKKPAKKPAGKPAGKPAKRVVESDSTDDEAPEVISVTEEDDEPSPSSSGEPEDATEEDVDAIVSSLLGG